MEQGAVSAAGTTELFRRADDVTAVSSLVLLLALAAAAFGQGGFFSSVRLFIMALLAVAVVLTLVARQLLVADLRWLVWAGVLLAGWALYRGWTAGTAAGGISWALFAAGTVAVLWVCRSVAATARGMLLGGLLAVGVAVALSGWLGVALHLRPWGLPSQGLWRAASTVTYANATAGLLVPLGLVALARLTATPRSIPLALAATCLLTGAAATLSRAGIAALGAGLVVLCWLLGPRRMLRAIAVPAVGAAIALVGLLPSLRVTAPARPVFAAVAMAAGLGFVILARRCTGWKLVVPFAGAALAAAVFVIVLAPQVHHAIHVLALARLTLASPARSGETAAAQHVIASHPLLGVGPGHDLRWTGPGGVVNVDQYAHDEYLQVLTDLGAAGAALAAMMLIAAGRLLWQARASSSDGALWAGAVAAAVAFALHSGFDFLWQVPVVPLTVAALVGLAISRPTVQRHESPDIAVPRDRS